MDMDSLFESYDSDLSTVLSSISTKLAGDAKDQRGDPRKALFGRIERELEEADEIVRRGSCNYSLYWTRKVVG